MASRKITTMERFSVFQGKVQRISAVPMTGFSLVEILLSISLIGILTMISIPTFRGIFLKNELDVAATTIAQSLRRAQVLSQSVDGDTTWGVKVQSGKIAVFKGASYTGDPDIEEAFTMPTNIVVSGVSEIVFAEFTGDPQTTGTITLTTDSGDSRNIVINGKGMVSY